MKLDIRWEPRWPAFAIGFLSTNRRGERRRYEIFTVIIWALVIELGWGEK